MKTTKKTTVATLQKAVKATEKKLKKAKRHTLKAILGYPMAAIARAFGKHGFKPADAVAGIHKVEPKASVLAIRTYVQAGRHGLRGDPAPVKKAQLKKLVQAAA